MKTHVLLVGLLVSSKFIFADIPSIVESKRNIISLYMNSHETEKMGYGNWNPYEDGEHLMIKTFVQPGDVVIDAGTHFDDWSILVLEHTHNNCSPSFEPVPYFLEK